MPSRWGDIMTATLATRPGFAARRPSDRAFSLVYLLIIWAAMVGGFGLDMIHKAAKGQLSYPWIIHLHAVVFGAWLVLLTVQMLLVRRNQLRLHRQLGVAALVILPLMLILGPAASITMLRLHFNDPHLDTAFMATQLTNVFGSVALSITGLMMRRDAAAHKRLMLLGMVALAEPGFSRLLADPLYAALGDGFINYIAFTYIGSIALVIGMGVYDQVTRRRLHPAYVAGALWIFANEVTAAYLYYQPWWAAFTRRLIAP